jgi:tetratricopeptide (TPR) repeat protein
MNTQQLIIIFSGAGAIIAHLLSHTKVTKALKILLGILCLTCIVTTSTLYWFDLEKKEIKEKAQETKIDQIDTHLTASLTVQDFIKAARINREADRITEAIYDAEKVVEMDSRSVVALNLLAVLYTEKGEYDEAIKNYIKIKEGLNDSTMSIDRDEYIYHTNFGKAYMHKGMWEQAKQEFQQCLTLNDSNLTCYLYLAKILDQLNDLQQLYEVSKKGATLFNCSAPLHNFLGKACIAKSRFDEAEQALLKAVEADSTFGQPHLFLGVVYFKKNQPKKSQEFVKTAISLDPTLVNDVEILRGKKLLD